MISRFIPPLRISFAGGGVRVISHIGTLKALNEVKGLNAIQEWSGVSAGAFLATLCSCGYTVPELENLVRTVDFTKTRSDEPGDILTVLESCSIDDGKCLEEFVLDYMKQKGFSRETTFQDIYRKTNYRLKMWASGLDTRQIYEFSTEKTPTYQVLPCLRSSMGLPLLYSPYKHPMVKQEKLIDGSCLLLNPIESMTPSEQAITLGVQFCIEKVEKSDSDSFLGFALNLINMYSRTLTKKETLSHPLRNRIIWSPCGSFSAWNVGLTESERNGLFQCGYKSAKEFLASSKSAKSNLKRRWSVS